MDLWIVRSLHTFVGGCLSGDDEGEMHGLSESKFPLVWSAPAETKTPAMDLRQIGEGWNLLGVEV